MSFSSDGRTRSRTDSGSKYGALDNPLALEAEASSAASPLVAARLKAANLLHGLGLLLMLMIFCALVVLISSVDNLTAATSAMKTDAAGASPVAIAGATDGARQPEPEPEPESEPTQGSEVAECPSGGSKEADAAIEGLLRQDGFFTLFTDNTTAPRKLLLAIPEAELDQPFILNSLRSKGTGFDHGEALHYPLEQGMWMFSRSPGNEPDPSLRGADSSTSLDLIVPQLAVRANVADPVPEPLADGIWTGWVETVDAKAVNMTCDGKPLAHLLDVTSLLQRTFLLSSSSLLARATTPVRVISAKAFPLNLEFVVEFMTTDRNGEPEPVSQHISLIRLPAEPMVARVSDDRVGYFETSFVALGLNEQSGKWNEYIKLCNRWRLEKAVASCTSGCLPKKQILYYIDPSVPERWRGAAKKAVDNWNGPFAVAGYGDAIRGVLPSDPDWPADYNAGDRRYASISWGPLLSHSGALAIGPHVTDPRTGETLDADIVIDSGWLNIYQSRDALQAKPVSFADELEAKRESMWTHGRKELDGPPIDDPGLLRASLIANGQITFDEPIPDEFINMALTSVLMHEVGHTLGLRHNFRGSTYFTMEELGDVEFINSTAIHGTAAGAITSSIMDYVPLNLHADASKRGVYYSLNPGKYDHLAIQYGYMDVAGEMSGEKHHTLEALAASLPAGQATFPGGSPPGKPLVFATDEDSDATDPYVDTYDQSVRPLDYFADTLDLVSVLMPTLANRSTPIGSSWYSYAAEVRSLVAKVSTTGIKAAKYVGGRARFHSHRGDGVFPVTAIPMDEQLAAFGMCLRTITDASFLPPVAVANFMAAPSGAGGGQLDGCSYGLDAYCLGNTAVDLLTEFSARQRLTMRTLFSSSRMARVEENLWALNADDVAAGQDNRWDVRAFLDVMSLELFPGMAQLRTLIQMQTDDRSEAATRWAAWFDATVVQRDASRTLTQALEGWRRLAIPGENPAADYFIKTQLQGAWVEQLIQLRGEVTTPVQIASAVSLTRLATFLELLDERGDHPVNRAFLDKIHDTTVPERARNVLLARVADSVR